LAGAWGGDAVLSCLEPAVPKSIRRSLREIGHIAAERGEIEKLCRIPRRKSRYRPLQRAPDELRSRSVHLPTGHWRVRQDRVLWATAASTDDVLELVIGTIVTQPMQANREHINTFLAQLYCSAMVAAARR